MYPGLVLKSSPITLNCDHKAEGHNASAQDRPKRSQMLLLDKMEKVFNLR